MCFYISQTYNNNNNHGSTALYGLGPPISEVRLCAFAAVRDRLTGRAFQLDPDVTARAISSEGSGVPDFYHP
jgi:hypothetical protein